MNAKSASLAFVFPGQGSQSVGMLAELAAAHPEVQASFEEASQGAGLDLWNLAAHGPEDQLNRTENTQPALLAASVAVWRVWQKLGGAQPSQFSGHSLGEYSALVCANALSLHDAASLVAERGRLMQAAVPAGVGAMAAILGGDDAQIAAVCEEVAQGQVVAPANFNSPGQLVIAGNAEAVDRALARLAELGVKKAIKLAVSVPSHCALMRDAADRLGERMASISWRLPSTPVVQNAEARKYTTVDDIRSALQRQLYLPVRWTQCVQALASGGATRLAECGPGKVLTGLIKRIDKSLEARAIGTPTDIDTAVAEWV
ncbi:[acyl-carrier-protein] S-malonyltransferase [Rhodanobacter sp. ANJX3]|uniref:ACP S-malonyltransferase n=1 Tax=unclassified Rhodanobacter TaxID=2621553 RepID=UPI0015CDA203|nr:MULTISPECIES: ACP S-malonyltransferase [unclassified Rhodanobacter]MBB5357863.1 [acyl-carrier-protein] S-malonyltransferase [Rhodanobacter sp. ANJX3]NYE30492.1 [acyl-carrier-protein] S-malonyltransferase [Rhodanobacter sp. K2T2]